MRSWGIVSPPTPSQRESPRPQWLGAFVACGQGRGRTADLPLFRRTLVPTELPAQADETLQQSACDQAIEPGGGSRGQPSRPCGKLAPESGRTGATIRPVREVGP